MGYFLPHVFFLNECELQLEFNALFLLEIIALVTRWVTSGDHGDTLNAAADLVGHKTNYIGHVASVSKQ